MHHLPFRALNSAMNCEQSIHPANPRAIERATAILRDGGLVAFPTETVYGLGADATNGRAVARLYEAKGRPAFNPLIAHVTDVGAAQMLARFDADAERLAAALWPGPLTLVLPKAAACPVAELATAGLDSVAVRNCCITSLATMTCLGATTSMQCASEGPRSWILMRETTPPTDVMPSQIARYSGRFGIIRQTVSPLSRFWPSAQRA